MEGAFFFAYSPNPLLGTSSSVMTRRACRLGREAYAPGANWRGGVFAHWLPLVTRRQKCRQAWRELS